MTFTVQWKLFQLLKEMSEDTENLPEAPEEPLPSDCCGGGCVPCVMDVYQEQLEQWLQLKAMAPGDRARWMQEQEEKAKGSNEKKMAVSLSEYRTFTVEEVEKVSDNCFVFTFLLPSNKCLGLRVGQHIVVRCSSVKTCEPGNYMTKFADRVRESDGSYVSRPYTPISPLEQTGSFRVLIKVRPRIQICM